MTEITDPPETPADDTGATSRDKRAVVMKAIIMTQIQMDIMDQGRAKKDDREWEPKYNSILRFAP